MSGVDQETARRMARDVCEAALAPLKELKGLPSAKLVDCMLAAVAMAHVEAMRALVKAEGIDDKTKSKLSMLMTIANAYSVGTMQLAQDPNTLWEADEAFALQLEHKLTTLFDNANTFDLRSGGIF